MPIAPANGIEIYYETFGEPDGEPLLLVNGLGSQCISYEPDFCNAFVDRGFYVIRFDNRDVGLSTKIDTDQIDFPTLIGQAMAGESVEAPYYLSDMAADAVGLLDHLGIERAHIVGMSMGGMIVQTIAIEHHERVLTMTSIMSMTGDRDVAAPTPEAAAVLLAPPATSRDEFIENYVKQWEILAGPVYFDDTRFRDRAGPAYDRCYFPAGTGRQLLGILASGSRSERLRTLKVPTLVIHGKIDPLVTLSGGERTAEVIPGAQLIVFDDMGHDLPPALWPQYVEAITNHASSVRSGS
ncbi:MAG TPA: alpha/beta hydrolase [Acidimicrobiales bacterium]